ncbi:hypothetical protein GCM10029964_076190 [Kibdelosporangium lantanae]
MVDLDLLGRQRFRRRLVAWARGAGWTYSTEPHGENVRQYVHGCHRGRAVTATYVEYRYQDNEVQETWIVIHLRRTYPVVKVERRNARAAEFESRFRVHAASFDAARTFITRDIAAAHMRDAIPLWSLAGHEFVVTVPGWVSPTRLRTEMDPAIDLATRLSLD